MTDKIIDSETEFTEKQLFEYQEFLETFITGFTTKMFHEGIITEVTSEQLQKYFAEPDKNVDVLSDLAEYFYITTGDIHMMFELIESLPSLNYKVNAFDKSDSLHDKHVSTINRVLHKIKHKPLTRDVMKQTANTGTLTGIWLGSKSNPYPYIFDSPEDVFPAYRRNGDWVVHFDLKLLDEYKEYYQNIIFDNLSPYVTKQMYENYKSNLSSGNRYVELPQDRTFVVHTHKLKHNQGLGTSWANPAMFDVLHKKKMKNVERAIANKIINAIAVLTIGNEKDPANFGNIKLNKTIKKKVHNGVKTALEKSATDGVPVISLPEFAKLEFPDIKTDGLDGKMFDNLNTDIQSSLGLSGAVVNGDGGNHASAKLNLDVMYKRIGVLLEQIETDMIQKMINLILPKKQADNYYLTYEKSQPLTTKETIDVLMKLNDKGWSIKSVVDRVDDISWESYLEQTLHETETLELQSRIKPYLSSYTATSSDGSGANEINDNDISDEGASTRDSDKNNM